MAGHGIIRGIKRPDVHGDKRGLVLNGMSGVTQDATSGIYVPSSATEWTATMAAAGISSGNPTGTYLMQDASGNLLDVISSRPLLPSGSPGYQAAVTSWSRSAVTTANAGLAKFNVVTGIPAPETNSTLWLVYAAITSTPSSNFQFMQVANTGRLKFWANSTPRYQCTSSVNTATGTVPVTNVVRPFALKHDITNLVDAGYSNAEVLKPTYFAITNPGIGIGANDNQSCAASYLYAALWTGVSAELTDAQIRTLYQTLGWTVAW